MSNGVTSKIIEATTKYAGLWEQEMDKYYYLLMDALDEDNREYLIDSQKSWETYSNENCDLVFKSTAQLYGEGSYLNILEVDLILQKYRKRTYELKELYKSLGIAK